MYEDPDGSMVARNMIGAHLLQKWQTRWDTARTGPNLRNRLKYKWIRQLLTGHGSLKFKFHALGLIYDPHCNCHQIQRIPQATAGGGANQRCRLASGAPLLGNEGRLPGGTEVYHKSAPTTVGRGTKTETPSRIV